MLVRKDKKKAHSGGFIGAAKATKKAPYYQLPRTPDMYPAGENSKFITPKTQEEINASPRGIKR